ALYFYRDAEDPLRATLRYDRLVWREGEIFEGNVFLCDDRKQGAVPVSVSAYREGYSLLPGADNEALRIPVECAGSAVRFTVPAGESFTAVCTAEKDGEIHRSVYLFLIGDENSPLPRAPILRFSREYRIVHGKEL
ncbi:MAG: hypothetical protein IIU08_02180, partial [Clostridia bacterium]|nr:hypothetical protein [Clostridia bacterium]